MLPWITVDEARTADGTVLTLARRGTEWEVCFDGSVLMSSRAHGSEEDLARLAFAKVPQVRTVLIGGLGLGFSLRATLDLLGPRGKVVVAEQSSSVVEWNRAHVGGLAGRPLEDPRVTVRVGDVRARIGEARAAWDLILLDVDNGPGGLACKANDRLYSMAGLKAAHAALRPAGVLAIWSAASDRAFSKRLRRAGFELEEVCSHARAAGRGGRRTIWLAVRGA